MKKLLLLLTFFLFIGCRYLTQAPFDGIFTKNVEKKPDINEMIGEWEINATSYKYLKNKGYDFKKVTLSLNENGTFNAIDFPNLLEFSLQDDMTGYASKTGEWRLSKDFKEQYWDIVIGLF
jgi:hypothetical protein